MPYSVLFTEDMEPITILELSQSMEKVLFSGQTLVIPVMRPLKAEFFADDAESTLAVQPIDRVRIRGDVFVRRNRRHMFMFTVDEEAALLLRSAFLPGQRASLEHERAMAFGKGFLEGLKAFRQQG